MLAFSRCSRRVGWKVGRNFTHHSVREGAGLTGRRRRFIRWFVCFWVSIGSDVLLCALKWETTPTKIATFFVASQAQKSSDKLWIFFRGFVLVCIAYSCYCVQLRLEVFPGLKSWCQISQSMTIWREYCPISRVSQCARSFILISDLWSYGKLCKCRLK